MSHSTLDEVFSKVQAGHCQGLRMAALLLCRLLLASALLVLGRTVPVLWRCEYIRFDIR